MPVQSYIVPKSRAKSRKSALAIVRKRGGKTYTSRETSTSWRVRQRPPGDFVQTSLRTRKVGGIQAVVGKLKAGKH